MVERKLIFSSRVTSADFRFRPPVRDRLAPERPPRGWRLLRPLPGGYDGIPSGPASRARTGPYPCCRLPRRATGICCLRRRATGARRVDGRGRHEAAHEPGRRHRSRDSRLAAGLGRRHAVPCPRDGLRSRRLAPGRQPPEYDGRHPGGIDRAASAGRRYRTASSRGVRGVRPSVRPALARRQRAQLTVHTRASPQCA